MIYLDNAATTKLDIRGKDITLKYLDSLYFNPSAIYKPGVEIKIKLEREKEEILSLLKASSHKLVFTSSGTEANNLAILGVKKDRNSTILVSKLEHASVFNPCNELKNQQYNIKYLKTTKTGHIDLDYLKSVVDKNVSFVSIQHVSNETGAINDLKTISKIIKNKNKNAILHVDGVQALGKTFVDIDDFGIEMYTFSGHKIGSPKGVGGLVYRKDLHIKPLILGGGQEFNLRSSTENIPAIFAFSHIFKEKEKNKKERMQYVDSLREELLKALNKEKINFEIITDLDKSSPYILMIAFPEIKGEVLLHALEEDEIYVSTGSACTSNVKNSKRTIQALGLDKKLQGTTIRISFSENNNKEEMVQVAKKIKEKIKKYAI